MWEQFNIMSRSFYVKLLLKQCLVPWQGDSGFFRIKSGETILCLHFNDCQCLENKEVDKRFVVSSKNFTLFFTIEIDSRETKIFH